MGSIVIKLSACRRIVLPTMMGRRTTRSGGKPTSPHSRGIPTRLEARLYIVQGRYVIVMAGTLTTIIYVRSSGSHRAHGRDSASASHPDDVAENARSVGITRIKARALSFLVLKAGRVNDEGARGSGEKDVVALVR